jgi:phosphohistidine phosphatase
MKLYLVQHAKAAGKEVDPERSLTDEGREDTIRITNFIKDLGLSVDSLWHSGKKRAAQTAEFLSEAFHVANPIEAMDCLGPNDEVGTIELQVNAVEQDIIIVGHLPFLSKLASRLLSGDDKAEIIKFSNSGIVCLERDEKNRWHLNWAIMPDLV